MHIYGFFVLYNNMAKYKECCTVNERLESAIICLKVDKDFLLTAVAARYNLSSVTALKECSKRNSAFYKF